MIINDTMFPVDLATIIEELRSQLTTNHIHLLNKIFDSGDDIMVCCPYHKEGQERRPSAGIRKSDGLFHCLACGETHSLPEVISYCFGYNDPFGREGYKWLCKNFATVEVQNREAIKIDLARNHISGKGGVLANNNSSKLLCVSEEELDSYRYLHPYVYERGVNDDIIELFDIGYDKRTNSITFPVRNIRGNCLFVARRSVDSKRFDLPRGIEKPLYGLYELNHLLETAPTIEVHINYDGKYMGNYTTGHVFGWNEIYVVEGLFDCLRLWSVGKPAVAGFGCLFNKLQIDQLNKLPTRRLILATDNDNAGMKARERLRKLIRNKIITEVILPEGRKDIGECTDEEIQNLKEVF